MARILATGQGLIERRGSVMHAAMKLVSKGFARRGATLAICSFIAWPVASEIWKLDGNWVLSASPKLGGCTLATKFDSGAFLSVSSVAKGSDARVWELLVSESAWTDVQNNARYEIALNFPGTARTAQAIEMTGVNTQGTHGTITTALMVQLADHSEATEFVLEGFRNGRSLDFTLDGHLIGSFNLTNAKAAVDAMERCIFSSAANYEA